MLELFNFHMTVTPSDLVSTATSVSVLLCLSVKPGFSFSTWSGGTALSSLRLMSGLSRSAGLEAEVERAGSVSSVSKVDES